MEERNGLKYEKLTKGNYKEQIELIIKKYFDGCKIYDGQYLNNDFSERYLFFRGQSDFEWDLTPAINREIKNRNKEAKILKEVLEANPSIGRDKLIAYAQHYDKKTRAIDFTSDFKVALYFACKKNKDKDGAVYMIGYVPHKITLISSLTINLIALMEDEIVKDEELANKLIKNSEYREKYEKRSNEKNVESICMEYSAYINDGFMVVYDYENEETNERIKKQKGSLFYCGCKYYIGSKYCEEIGHSTNYFPQYDIHLHEIKNPTGINKLCVKIRIPKELKQDILNCIDLSDEKLGL